MTDIPLVLQNVNGDPFTSGGNINITTGTTSSSVFSEGGAVSLSTVLAGDSLDIGGLVYSYDYLGTHLVRGDVNDPAAYIRIIGPLPAGSTLTIGTTYAIDMSGMPGDPDYPDLPNGNTKASVADLDTTTDVQFPGYVCFTRGTLIDTPKGPVAVENLVQGDEITTIDRGAQPIFWIGRRKIWANPSMAPVVISAGVLSNTSDLTVSPCHRVLLSGWQAEMMFAVDEVLVAAQHLLHLDGVYRARAGSVEYFHILLPHHEIVFANGQPSESLHCHLDSLKLIDPEGQNEILTIFPELNIPTKLSAPLARPALRKFEARLLS